MSVETTQTQCHAITADGQRCARPAGEDGFCYQHDENDETVDEYEEEEVYEEEEETVGETVVRDGGAEEVAEEEAAEEEAAEEETAEEEESRDADESSEADAEVGLSGVREVREAVQSLAPEVIGRELDAVIEVDGREDGWLAVVEIVERPAVPDSQDILGRYEIELEGDTVSGYRRVDRYRRGDTDAERPR